MSHVKVKGFVLREVPVGDSDRILSVLTEDHGLLTVSAQRSRTTRSPLLLSTQVFSFSEFELFHNKGRYRVNAASLIEAFWPVHRDIERLVCASHLAEVFVDSMRDEVAQPAIYRLWAFAMQALQAREDPLLTVHIAQFRLMIEIGYSPCISHCVVCGTGSGLDRFSLVSCGIVCGRRECMSRASQAFRIEPGVHALLEHIQSATVGRLFNLGLSSEARNSFIELSGRYLSQQMEKNYTRLDMLKDLNQMSDQNSDNTEDNSSPS